jgi:hypothetical protein
VTWLANPAGFWWGLGMIVLIALLCVVWFHAGVEWMREALIRDYKDEGIGP